MNQAASSEKNRTLKLIALLCFFGLGVPGLLVGFSLNWNNKLAATHGAGAFFVKHRCTGCHSVSSLGIKAGQMGPDLSDAVVDAPRRLCRSLDEFLPTGTMALVLSSRILLTEAEKREALEALKLAYQRKLEQQQNQK
jgi:hypothetical protein